MFTHLLRLALAHSLKPFLFKAVEPEREVDHAGDSFLGSEDYGLYIHIPFCREICDFCPYNKILYDSEKMSRFVESLKAEAEMNCSRIPEGARLRSIYFGGGSPALAAEYLPGIIEVLERCYGRAADIGVELHPRDADSATLDRLKSCGVNMVSIGVQSFEGRSLEAIGRGGTDGAAALMMAREKGFVVVDSDLIFALPGQSEDSLLDDFRKAAEAGAKQISTYPFIRFSFAGGRYPRPSAGKQRRLLKVLAGVSDSFGFRRTSVWTFAAEGSGRYSSVTRNNVLGLGPSATSLFAERFTINTFSVEEYCDSLEAGRSPRALELRFSPRVRRMYWLFWSCYNLHLSDEEFRRFFGLGLTDEFGGVLRAALLAGLIRRNGSGYDLTGRGALWFHRVEQIYTHQYISKTWRICSRTPRPRRIGLF